MNRPVQYILCGIPFSGKTTLGKALKKLRWVFINLDEIKAAKEFGNVSDDDVPDEVWKTIYAEADKKLIEALKSGKNVANETAWVTRAWRDRVREIAKKEGFDTKVIYIKIPQDKARRRWQKNRQNLKRYDTKDDEFAGYLKDFEEPSENEGLIIYDQTISPEEWIKITF